MFMASDSCTLDLYLLKYCCIKSTINILKWLFKGHFWFRDQQQRAMFPQLVLIAK